MPQQTFLFDDTVRGNVTLGLDVPDSEVWRALRVAQADRFVDALPDGLDTRIGERGTTLSGGQRQRLALARALVRPPRLLVMDDATSAVDPRVEAAILAGLRSTGGAEGAPTVVVVAYRKATIALADEVVYVEHGRVVDRGHAPRAAGRCTGYRRCHGVRAGGRRARRPRCRRGGLRAGGLSAVVASHGTEILRNHPLHAQASPPIALHSLSGPPGRLSRHPRHAGLRPARGCGSALG